MIYRPTLVIFQQIESGPINKTRPILTADIDFQLVATSLSVSDVAMIGQAVSVLS